MSGEVTNRPALREALDYARNGDTLIVWRLDRPARSMKRLIETIEKLLLRNMAFGASRTRTTRRPMLRTGIRPDAARQSQRSCGYKCNCKIVGTNARANPDRVELVIARSEAA
jgi:Resolvase, N terminal domain